MKTIHTLSIIAIALLLFVINFGFMQLTLQDNYKAAAFGAIFSIFGLNILLNYRAFSAYKNEALAVILIYVVVECLLAGLYVWASIGQTSGIRFRNEFSQYAGLVYGVYSFVVLSANMPTIHRNIAQLKGNIDTNKPHNNSNNTVINQAPALNGVKKFNWNEASKKEKTDKVQGMYKQGFTESQIANKLNVHQTTVNKYKNM